jgi:hypothetical protein
MKKQLAILSLMSLELMACGVHRQMDAKNTLNASDQQSVLEVKASDVSGEFKQLNADNLLKRYHIIAKIKDSDLPESFKKLPSESQIGTLSLTQQSTIYQAEYEENSATPIVQSSVLEQAIPTLIFNFNSHRTYYLGVPIEYAKKFQKILLPISVQVHRVSSYCSNMYVAYSRRGSFYMKEQNSPCDLMQNCKIRLHFEASACGWFCAAGYHDQTRQLQFLYDFGGRCTQWRNVYERTETQVNESVPEHGRITLSQQANSLLNQILVRF